MCLGFLPVLGQNTRKRISETVSLVEDLAAEPDSPNSLFNVFMVKGESQCPQIVF